MQQHGENLQDRILRRLQDHGKPVVHTKMGFELDRGEFLCKLREMRELALRGLVEKTSDDRYWLTGEGVQYLHRNAKNPEDPPEVPKEDECQLYLYDEDSESGFIIRNEGGGLFKAEEWRNGDIADNA